MTWMKWSTFRFEMEAGDYPTNTGTGMVSVKLLCLFDLVYSTRSVTRAGEQMGQSQPTVSNWLGRLRTVAQRRNRRLCSAGSIDA